MDLQRRAHRQLFLIAASYSGGFAIFEDTGASMLLLAGIAGFLAVMAEAVIIQQKCVDAAKKTNPEKTASVYDVKFQKKWMDSCDEAEKILIGKCAVKAYRAVNTVCTVLAVIFAVGPSFSTSAFCPPWPCAWCGWSASACIAGSASNIPGPGSRYLKDEGR